VAEKVAAKKAEKKGEKTAPKAAPKATILSKKRPRYDLAVGLNKGFKTTKNPQKPRPSRRKGVS
jgi:hypothetical protein